MSKFSDFPAALQSSHDKFTQLLSSDEQLSSFTTKDAIPSPVTFGIKSSTSDNTLLITITNNTVKASTGTPKETLFTLSALPEHWAQHFQSPPPPPYQSYWGISNLPGASIQGSNLAFTQHAHIWRRVLELLHIAHCGSTTSSSEKEAEPQYDYLTGKYTYLTVPPWGRTKIFYEYSGEGKQPIIFLHSAGSDARQYHGVMNDARMRKKCIMYVFDLPGHGRSFPSTSTGKEPDEESYVGIIGAFVKALGLRRPIICGGAICLSVAMRHKEVGVGGIIPFQSYSPPPPPSEYNNKSPYINASLFAPEYFLSLLPPTTPHPAKLLLQHTQSSVPSPSIPAPKLNTPSLSKIDTQNCPVYLLCGSYATPSQAKETADAIPGAEYKEMQGLGYFAATENAGAFVGYLVEAVEHVQRVRSENLSTMRLGNGTD